MSRREPSGDQSGVHSPHAFASWPTIRSPVPSAFITWTRTCRRVRRRVGGPAGSNLEYATLVPSGDGTAMPSMNGASVCWNKPVVPGSISVVRPVPSTFIRYTPP